MRSKSDRQNAATLLMPLFRLTKNNNDDFQAYKKMKIREIKPDISIWPSIVLLRFCRPSFSPSSSSALFCPLFRATAAAFATVGAKKESAATAQHQDEQQQKEAQHVQQQQPLKKAKFQMGNNRRTARLAHANDDSADQLDWEDWAHFEMVERQLDELLEHHVDKLDEEGDVFGVDMVADPLNEPDISEMETGDETASRPINQFRQILYTEGELDKSDLGQPPSRENPHPFDPSTLPPTHSRNPTPYANHSPTLQMLLELGVDLFEVCQAPKIGRALLRLDPERDVKAKIFWLVKRCGVPEADIGPYLTRNPYFLLQSFDDLKARLDYLQFHRFSRRQITKLVVENRYWLNIPHERIDARLGWLQRQFHLRADELRLAIVNEPRLIQFGVGPIQGFFGDDRVLAAAVWRSFFLQQLPDMSPVQINRVVRYMRATVRFFTNCKAFKWLLWHGWDDMRLLTDGIERWDVAEELARLVSAEQFGTIPAPPPSSAMDGDGGRNSAQPAPKAAASN
ncbi:hypothetical protein niasHT_008469 [Heterodera trifolii]|uniref:Uncharacterized protein n=1 Tax=Heterodera trifolii TaxID=157864 RepID=A0ABD2M5M9_9BILA